MLGYILKHFVSEQEARCAQSFYWSNLGRKGVSESLNAIAVEFAIENTPQSTAPSCFWTTAILHVNGVLNNLSKVAEGAESTSLYVESKS